MYRQYYWSLPPETKDVFNGQSLMFDIFDDQSMESFWCHKSADIPSEVITSVSSYRMTTSFPIA